MTEEVKKQRRGFALMNPERLKAVSSKGGKNCPPESRGFSNPKVAKSAAKLGGRARR